jgi:hypothetical protein
VVEEVEPCERLTFWWWAEDEPATHVELTLVPAVSGTVVRVVESGYVTTPYALSGVALAPRWHGYAGSPSLPVGRIEIRESKVAGALDRLGRALV